MKKIISFILTFLFVASAYSQVTLKLYNENDEEISNTTELLIADTDYYMKIENTSSSDIDVVFIISEILIPQGASGVEVCYFGNCFPPTDQAGQLGDPYTIPANSTYYNDADHMIYHADGQTGHAYFEVTVQEEGNESNAVSYMLDTQVSTYSLNGKEESIKVYPNPASDRFSVKIDDKLTGSQIIFTNMLGKIIYTDILDAAVTNFTTEKFSNGVYFYTLVHKGKIFGTKKIIIK